MRLALRAALLLALLLAAGAAPAQAFTVAGFERSATPLLSVSEPTDLAFTPDERLLLIAEKAGRLRLADVSAAGDLALRSTPALDIRAKVCSNSERGLLGVAADPAFAQGRHIYLYYTYDRGVTNNRCATNSSGVAAGSSSPINRVSRFTLASSGVVDPASERVLVDNMPSPAGNHNAGAIGFGRDGYLYIAIGDGGCDYAGGGCGGSNNAARDANVLVGKLLRIIPNPDLTPADRIPPSNPFAASGTVCAVTGRGPSGTPVSTPCRETFASGLRNPFRFAFDPNTVGAATQLYINDVGQGRWEEVNRSEAGADYRWNLCEGSYQVGSGTLCAPPSGAQRNPAHEYSHDTGCGSITAGVAVPNGVWDASYNGDYLYADAVCGTIFRVDWASPGSRTVFADGMSYIASMVLGPGPNGVRALYTAQVFSGEIHRYLPQAGNRLPVAALSASPQFGDRVVSFSGAGSSDPDNDAIEAYLWDFGNGVTRETAGATTSYTYPADGVYTASLRVRDAAGALSLPATLPIDTLNDAPQVTMSAPASGARFSVGQTITLSASASDAQDGDLPAAALSWQVVLHHRAGQPGAHYHPYFGPQSGTGLTFTAPSPEDLDAASSSYLEVILTAVDSGGAYTVVRRDLLPLTVPVTVQTSPAGLVVTINGTDVSDDMTVTSWQGYLLTRVALPQRKGSASYALSSWDNGATASERELVTPSAARTVTATFGPAPGVYFAPVVQRSGP